MKKLEFLFLSIAMLCIFSGCSQNQYSTATNTEHFSKNEYNYLHTDNVNDTPNTLMDLFDGNQKIWFLTETDELSYDSNIELVLITENKSVTAAYYFIAANKVRNMYPQIKNHQISSFELCDFEGMSDEQIIDKVKSSYVDASVTYSLELFNQLALRFQEQIWERNIFPLDIKYSGELDSSGNNIAPGTERVLLLTHYETQEFEFEFHKTLMPTQIKDKQYVGIIGYAHYDEKCLITVNNFKNFNSINNDSHKDY